MLMPENAKAYFLKMSDQMVATAEGIQPIGGYYAVAYALLCIHEIMQQQQAEDAQEFAMEFNRANFQTKKGPC